MLKLHVPCPERVDKAPIQVPAAPVPPASSIVILIYD